jgi:hypothetical protein
MFLACIRLTNEKRGIIAVAGYTYISVISHVKFSVVTFTQQKRLLFSSGFEIDVSCYTVLTEEIFCNEK